MRARAWALSLLSSTAVLTIGWQLGMQAHDAVIAPVPAATSAGNPTSTGTGAPAASPSPLPSAAVATPAPTPTEATAATFVGDAAQTPFGPVQVKVTVTGGTITDVTALSLTDRDPRSVSISNRAAPVLREEVLQAQSAHVDGVSGATYTTDGYLTSLQSALDQAGL